MLWIIALLCLGIVGAIGYYQGPIRVAASLLGLVFGSLLAVPLSPLTKKLLPVLGLHHPGWELFVPALIAFLIVLLAFKILGHVLHRKLSIFYKYKKDDKAYYRWSRMYSRVGLCLGLLNGAVYFLLLMLPVYIAGYFTTEVAQGAQDPSSVQNITKLREEMHSMKLDRVLAGYDPTPKQTYQAADIVGLVMHNPLLESRLAHYPPFLTLGERPEFKDLGNDVQLQQMIQSQASIGDILKNAKVQALVTNTAVTQEITQLVANDLEDLSEYLKTGHSAKYDPQAILGVWKIDRDATFAQEKRKLQNPTPLNITKLRNSLMPVMASLNLTVTTDHNFIIKKDTGNGLQVIGTGTWKKEGDGYQINLPGNQPDNAEVVIKGDDQLLMPRNGVTMVFSKEL
ncbi:MAG: CvpA family protein [Limisphaerales bacterium]